MFSYKNHHKKNIIPHFKATIFLIVTVKTKKPELPHSFSCLTMAGSPNRVPDHLWQALLIKYKRITSNHQKSP